MKTKLLLTSVLASLLMAGSAFADDMDSQALHDRMEELNEQRIKATGEDAGAEAKVEALENQVQQLQELIQMMIDAEGVEPHPH